MQKTMTDGANQCMVDPYQNHHIFCNLPHHTISSACSWVNNNITITFAILHFIFRASFICKRLSSYSELKISMNLRPPKDIDFDKQEKSNIEQS